MCYSSYRTKCPRLESPCSTPRGPQNWNGADGSALPMTLPSESRLGPDISKACLDRRPDRKSTRLNSSHEWMSYAVFCLKKKKGILVVFVWVQKKEKEQIQ